MGLAEYRKKRRLHRTPEPAGTVRRRGARRAGERAFVIQEHAASSHHYDFRLEHDGVLKSWAVPKGPSLDPADKRLAVAVEDHPLDYGAFEGVIPAGEYGAGSVIVWDRGRWFPEGDVDQGLREGELAFRLEGEKLHGSWVLVRLHERPGKSARDWLLIKRRDAAARPKGRRPVTSERPESVATGRTIEEVAGGGGHRKLRASGPRLTARTTRQSPARGNRPGVRPGTAKRRPRSGPAAKAAALPRVERGELPEFVAPELATLVGSAPQGDGWVHEIKYDGYRMLARLDRGDVRWLTRSGLDWTDRFPSLARAIAELPAERALLDGEIAVLRPDGTTSFQDLQNVLGGGRGAPVYFAFDLLHLDGFDLRPCPLTERKEVLRLLLDGAGPNAPLRYGEHVAGDGHRFYLEACRASLEGIVAKRGDRSYRSGRSRDWVKVKCGHEQEFVLAGFTEPAGSRVGLGALVLGVREGRRLRYAGRVGTGFDHATLLRLRKLLEPLATEEPPFGEPLPAAARRSVTWVRPRLVAEVAFTGWTDEGLLRHPSFKGLREDKSASEVVRERPARAPAARAARHAAVATSARRVAGVALTHPERVVFPGQGITKLELARFYERIAPRILPHVADRPLSIVRCPRGSSRSCFFQKHAQPGFPEEIRSVAVEEASRTAEYLMVDSVEGLVALVQMGALELHPWGARADRIDRPDRMLFDLDPGPGVPWKRVVEAALELRERLARIDLVSFVKTTGSKGLHVVVPLARRHGWDAVKSASHAIAADMAREQPELYVASASKALREKRIFVDYLRNARGATAVAPYSTRARPDAPVATPVSWKELEGDLSSDAFRVEGFERRLRGDPWKGFLELAQTLPAAPSAARKRRS